MKEAMKRRAVVAGACTLATLGALAHSVKGKEDTVKESLPTCHEQSEFLGKMTAKEQFELVMATGQPRCVEEDGSVVERSGGIG